MRSLTIYYSETGNTRIVADTLKNELKSHRMEVIDLWKNKTLSEILFPTIRNSSQLKPYKVDVDPYYELIFVGTPVWFGSVTPAIAQFIKNSDFKGKDVVIFNTFRFAGAQLSIKRLAKLIKKSNGNVIGAFSVKTNSNNRDIVENTKKAIEELSI